LTLNQKRSDQCISLAVLGTPQVALPKPLKSRRRPVN